MAKVIGNFESYTVVSKVEKNNKGAVVLFLALNLLGLNLLQNLFVS